MYGQVATFPYSFLPVPELAEGEKNRIPHHPLFKRRGSAAFGKRGGFNLFSTLRQAQGPDQSEFFLIRIFQIRIIHMTLNTKLILFYFLFGGIFMALMFWAMDDVEGKPFDLMRFLLRVLIFGTGMTLAKYLGKYVGKRFEKMKAE